jgi:hypothetical protein
MKVICRVLSLAIVSGALIGCGDPAAPDTSATATPDNPKAAIDAMKKIGPPMKEAPKTP